MNGGEDVADDEAAIRQRPQAIFIMGGGASGKGTVTDRYRKRENIAESVDSDAIKTQIAIYSDKVRTDGTGGPSGPRSIAAFRNEYPQDVQDRVNAFVAKHTQYTDVADFAAHNDVSAGITHELSSYIAKARLAKALAEGQSFIYDSTGSDNYRVWAQQARDKEMAVTIHYVFAPRAVALMRNNERPRTVPADQLLGTHDKADRIAPKMHEFAAKSKSIGMNVTFRRTNAYTKADEDRAVRLGYTDIGGPRT